MDKHSEGGRTGGLIRFHGVLPLGEVDVFIVLPLRLQLLLVLRNDNRQGVLRARTMNSGYARQSTAFG